MSVTLVVLHSCCCVGGLSVSAVIDPVDWYWPD